MQLTFMLSELVAQAFPTAKCSPRAAPPFASGETGRLTLADGNEVFDVRNAGRRPGGVLGLLPFRP
jgi:hypothetical protein